METITIQLPALYADHHVAEVRRLLLDMPGVQDVYASSGFQIVDITIDDTKTNQQNIEQVLADAGYTGELPIPVESSVAASESGDNGAYFRHTAAFAQTNQTVGFGQNVVSASHGLWPCPGIGAVKTMED